MKKTIVILSLLLCSTISIAHMGHYNKYNKIKKIINLILKVPRLVERPLMIMSLEIGGIIKFYRRIVKSVQYQGV